LPALFKGFAREWPGYTLQMLNKFYMNGAALSMEEENLLGGFQQANG